MSSAIVKQLVEEYKKELASDICKGLLPGRLGSIIIRILKNHECVEYLKNNDETFSFVYSYHENGEKLYNNMSYIESFAATIVTQTYH